MGYFFRPNTSSFTRHHKTLEQYKEICDTLEKLHPSPNDTYTLSFCDGKSHPSWRWWGYFIHDEEYYDIIDDLFIIHKDDYSDNLYELKRPDDGCSDFTREEFEAIWKILEETIKLCNPHILTDMGSPAIKDSLEYIMFSGWDFFHAY